MNSLVTTQWLADQIGARDLRIVDATYVLPDTPRDPRAEFVAAHIPGAVFLDLGEIAETATDLPSMLPRPEKFASRLQALGLGDGTRIVLYDESPLHSAARAWVMLRSFGIPDVAILDGGLEKWRHEARAIESGTPAPRPRHLTPRDRGVHIRDLAAMRANLETRAEQVVDARSPARFAGEEPEPRAGTEAGHIPGARNLHYATLFERDGTWKRGDALRAAFADSGVDPDKPIVATCGSGITASIVAFAAHLLGNDAAVYDGSWARMGRASRHSQDNRTRMTDHPTGPKTKVVEAGRRKDWTQGVVNTPVWRASTILYDSVAHLRETGAQDTHHRLFYGRKGTPTQWSLADALTALEPGAEGTFLYPSGVAAIAAALLSVLSPGDELLLVDSAYDPTRGMANGLLKRFGITTRFYDPMIGAGIAALIGPATRAILMESPGSLTFEVQDVPAIVAAAKARGVTTLLDNTWATPLRFPAIAHGVDLTILACTKYVVGHSDVMLGSVTAAPGHFKRLRDTSFQLGQVASPDDCWLGSRGLRTMAIRLDHHEASALRIARWLAGQPAVARVLHPALRSCPGHDMFARDFSGSTGLFSFVLDGGDEPARAALIDGLDHFGIGYSWGGFESLALPVDPQRYRTATRCDFAGPLVRLQIGLEDADDLIADLERGLARFVAARG